MGLFDSLIESLANRDKEDPEKKKKRLEEEAKKNPLLQVTRRKSVIDQAVEDAQK